MCEKQMEANLTARFEAGELNMALHKALKHHPCSIPLGRVPEICDANKDTLVVGQKSVSLCEYLVKRFEQKQTNLFAALFHLSHALQSYLDGTNVEECPPP
ncbi:hypothetical protein CYMTET_30287 [Cymbomonas tetramitiformis]|uniref:Uncharacterized protein n=1 Tax=Cymbomonas tetramitiformis TaxID=36881 RepID=A0AAE0KUC7_9CHLO|nr:hypothetical protein CYMTET_30287 [Cymbomonas tetramitiformis]